ncbi:pilus assembly protein TadG-related protein [Roseibium sp.]|uniref:pilus assembly protein TadG-related protein n=1 Tax=Roseibium sp. TaxID=1936156 RepID=UPI003B518295
MFKAYLKKLLRNENGAILPIFGVLVVILVVVAGAAIDISRAVNAREKLSYAIDAAALSVATDLSTSVLTNEQITDRITASFQANLTGAEFLDTAIDNLNFVVDSNEGTVTVASSASLSNYFLNIGGLGVAAFGPETFAFGTSAQVSYSRFDVELSLVVDVTGSMSDEIDDLKDAAEAVVDILIPETTTNSKVKISIVPYSVGVNLGAYADTATAGLSDRCATERDGAEKYTDASYSDQPVGDGSGTYRSRECSDSEILPLTDNRTTLRNSISALDTDGYTAGQTGIAWGWYTLSPNWADLWPVGSEPELYTNDKVLKFALIMTDGAFNTYYDLETLTKSQCDNHNYYGGTCYSGTNDYWIEYPSSGLSGASSQRAIQLCTQMKATDIELFTVYFGTNGSSNGAQVMQACADTGNYYQASSSSDLIQAFSNIAKKIQQIYLSQ